jgi:hypothetical protein
VIPDAYTLLRLNFTIANQSRLFGRFQYLKIAFFSASLFGPLMKAIYFMILILFSTVPSCAGNEKKKKATFSGWLRQVYLPEQDIQESLAEQKTQKECSPKCPKALYDLVERYFEPYKDGIYEDMISNARFPDDNVIKSRGLILIQVLNNTIYVDKSMMTYFEHYDQARLDFLLDRVHDYITRQSTKHLDIQSKDLDDQWNIKYSNFTDQSKDFEFVFVLPLFIPDFI